MFTKVIISMVYKLHISHIGNEMFNSYLQV